MSRYGREYTPEELREQAIEELNDQTEELQRLSLIMRDIREMFNEALEYAQDCAKENELEFVAPDMFASDQLLKETDIEWSTSSLFC